MIKYIVGITKKGHIKRLLGVAGLLLLLVGILLNPSVRSTRAAASVFADSSADWTTYMWDNGRSGYNSTETILNQSTASQLKLHWMYHAGGTINTQPVLVNGALYWGAWDGYEYATDLNGNVLWKTYLGKVTPINCTPPSAGVASTATVTNVSINGTPTEVVFAGGGDAHFYALDASNGNIIWSTQLGASPSHMIWDAPAIYNGTIYIGISSYGDCPLVQGQLIQMDEVTGAILHTFTTVPGKCPGGGIWGSPTIDEANNTIYVATGNGSCTTGSFSVIELNAADLSRISAWQIPSSQRTSDSDFGSTPTLFQATINSIPHEMVGAVSKSGYYYAFDRTNISAGPIWQKQLSMGKSNISPSAWDGTTLYAASSRTTIKGQSCNGSVRALDPSTGAHLWEFCTPDKVTGAVTLVPGLVIVGAGKYLFVLNAKTGQQLFMYHDQTSGSFFYGAASVSNGVLYIGSKDGTLFAFGL